MKFLTAIVIVAFVMLVSDRASAKSVFAATSVCQNISACFAYTKQHMQQPTAKLSEYANYAALPRRYNTGGSRAFVFSPRSKEWAAYDANGYKVSGGVANGGDSSHRTPRGTFRSYSRMGSGHVSSKYPRPNGGSPMPYAMHFTKAGHAVHGSPYIGNRNTSHGCIRVKTSAAKWLNHKFMTPGTKVIVHSY